MVGARPTIANLHCATPWHDRGEAMRGATGRGTRS